MAVQDWEARADREAALIVAELGSDDAAKYARLQQLVAIAWLKGFHAGTVETLDELKVSA